MSAITPESIDPLALPSLPLVDRQRLPDCPVVIYFVIQGEQVLQSQNDSHIVQLGKRRNLTQRQVAEAVRVNAQAISNWERGKTELRLTAVQWLNLIEVLQCSPSELVEDCKPSVEGEQ